MPAQAKSDPAKAPQPDKAAPVLPPGAPGPIPPGAPGIGLGPGQRPDPYEAYIRLEPPGRERLFGSRDTEKELEERMRQERKDTDPTSPPIAFPDKPELTTEAYHTRQFAPSVCLAEPSYVVYRRLYFEDKNAERYGWDLGEIQPAVSYALFIWDTLLLPMHAFNDPCRKSESSAGYCLPGDSTPYLLYPPEVTLSGALAEAAVIVALVAIFP